jgi:hypothetical protein
MYVCLLEAFLILTLFCVILAVVSGHNRPRNCKSYTFLDSANDLQLEKGLSNLIGQGHILALTCKISKFKHDAGRNPQKKKKKIQKVPE